MDIGSGFSERHIPVDIPVHDLHAKPGDACAIRTGYPARHDVGAGLDDRGPKRFHRIDEQHRCRSGGWQLDELCLWGQAGGWRDCDSVSEKSARTNTPYLNFLGCVGLPVHDPASSSPMQYLEVDSSLQEPS